MSGNTWATKAPEEVLDDIRAFMEWARTAEPMLVAVIDPFTGKPVLVGHDDIRLHIRREQSGIDGDH